MAVAADEPGEDEEERAESDDDHKRGELPAAEAQALGIRQAASCHVGWNIGTRRKKESGATAVHYLISQGALENGESARYSNVSRRFVRSRTERSQRNPILCRRATSTARRLQ